MFGAPVAATLLFVCLLHHGVVVQIEGPGTGCVSMLIWCLNTCARRRSSHRHYPRSHDVARSRDAILKSASADPAEVSIFPSAYPRMLHSSLTRSRQIAKVAF